MCGGCILLPHILLRIYNVPTQEVGGCFDTLHRNNSLRRQVTPIFLLIDQFLYRFSITDRKIWTLELNKKKGGFSITASSKIRPSWPSGVRENVFVFVIVVVVFVFVLFCFVLFLFCFFGRFLAWKKVLDCNNLLNGSIHIESNHSVFLPVVERLSFFSKSKWTRRRLQWPNLVI